MIVIDGAIGEGGGQILRSALSLSLLTGQAFDISNVRARRPNPGLRPQHLSAVQAAAQISRASVDGDRKGSTRITFTPGPVRPGVYHFDIGTAGATSLVLQTLLLPLAVVHGTSHLTIAGGTHVPWSPCFHYLDWHWGRILSRMGINFDLSLARAGFFPRGGGEVHATIPGGTTPTGLDLSNRGYLQRVRGLSVVANLPLDIAERQRTQSLKRLSNLITSVETDVTIESLPAQSRGTMLLLLAEFEHSQACFFALGARGKPAERVADEAVQSLAKFLETNGAIDPWLADQLLLPLALAKQSSVLRTSEVTQHLLTNLEVIRHFLSVEIVVDGTLGEPASIRLHT
ncbi:MAG: RNA 3'-terminal phosphate cyclase [Arenicellales bacterium]|nr:RNA 3'-terminal phosphate cyclase [Arenicellales bacterium]